MDKTFQQLKTHLLDMAYGASSSIMPQPVEEFPQPVASYNAIVHKKGMMWVVPITFHYGNIRQCTIKFNYKVWNWWKLALQFT